MALRLSETFSASSDRPDATSALERRLNSSSSFGLIARPALIAVIALPLIVILVWRTPGKHDTMTR